MKDQYLERLLRKRDQARQDGDKADEIRRTEEARDYSRQIKEYLES